MALRTRFENVTSKPYKQWRVLGDPYEGITAHRSQYVKELGELFWGLSRRDPS